MLRGILADLNIEGHAEALIQIRESPSWNAIWSQMALSIEGFRNLGLSRDASDLELWQSCQLHGLVLITANRNDEGPLSLESTIRLYSCETSLPVLTIANPQRFDRDREYASEVVERILDRLMNIEDYLGTGRLFV